MSHSKKGKSSGVKPSSAEHDASGASSAEQVDATMSSEEKNEPVQEAPSCAEVDKEACCEESVAEASPEVCSEQGEESKELTTLQTQLEEATDRYLRLSAEFDNYRKRTHREKQELISTAAASTIKGLLPVLDDFDRALVNTKESDDLAALQEGLELVKKNMDKFLRSVGVTEIEAEGLALDTDFHDAVTTMPAPEPSQKNKIVQVIKKGYLLNGNVIRHAQVIVGE